MESGRADRAALIYDSPVADTVRTYTYRERRDRVATFAGALAGHGVTRGERVIVFMPMVAEAVIAMLACARLGAGPTAKPGRRRRRVVDDGGKSSATPRRGPRRNSPRNSRCPGRPAAPRPSQRLDRCGIGGNDGCGGTISTISYSDFGFRSDPRVNVNSGVKTGHVAAQKPWTWKTFFARSTSVVITSFIGRLLFPCGS